MKIRYKNPAIEKSLISVNALTGAIVTATFVLLYGFDEIPMNLSVRTLHIVQIVAFMIFLAEKTLRFLNASSKKEFVKAFWFDIPLLVFLVAIIFSAGRVITTVDPGKIIMLALAVYLVLQVIVKLCRTTIDVASTGRNPTTALIAIFIVLIVTGAGLLMLPKAHNLESMSFVDSLFTATSATCVTGLIVHDTGDDFSVMGQIIILSLIQLGGLGIVIFGAVLALLLGQALTVRESVAMQDLLSTQTLGRIVNMIGFIFIVTILVEALGALAMLEMWDAPSTPGQATQHPVFCSVFHSISAFCNAGFSLFDSSLIDYESSWGVYTVIAPLIILGGLGFGVLYNLFTVACDRIARFIKGEGAMMDLSAGIPQKIQLQTKVVLVMTFILIVAGTAAISLFEHYSPQSHHDSRFKIALFQSITSRTAGFNTMDIASMSQASKLVIITLMFIGGSPGSTAGGIKTATLAVIVMAAYASLRKRPGVEIFKRSLPLVVVGRAITVVLFFTAVLIVVIFALCITERNSGFDILDISFEAASALGTVGLSTGVTASLTTAGKFIIIAAMLIGRLGPLTLLAALTFNIKPVVYDYPSEPIVVG